MGISIVDVAKAANVSHMTVSRVLNGNPNVLPYNIEAVRRAIADLGYVPPLRKRGPKPTSKRRSSKAIDKLAFMVPVDSDSPEASFAAFLNLPFGRDLMVGVIERANQQSIEVVPTPFVPSAPLPGHIHPQQIDGIIIPLYGSESIPIILAGIPASIPRVIIGHCDPRLRTFDAVMSDSDAIGNLAVKVLADRGCRHLATILEFPGEPISRSRCRAFRDAARIHHDAEVIIFSAAGHPHPQGSEPWERLIAAILAKEDTSHYVATLVDELLDANPMPDGLFIPHDLNAVGVHQRLVQSGIQLVRQNPETGKSMVLLTCGTEELPLRSLDPRPHCIGMDTHHVGLQAVEQLLYRVKHPHEPFVRILIPPKLMEASV
ncbi:hypothetical protein LCGC14_0550830 [marine sediment metagenome]|uniref:HTH lacI-type domain-containing protein n=1 Tax=marine sediment metagenome TaxID=412755 RepID=A0A0F9RPX7_9ZZZZ|nr:LacI family transcriptional regulator [Phycisphaerae bacterium]HDZ42595.1 LacI family transcriptional regulator [Phycisphaerae bacterium]